MDQEMERLRVSHGCFTSFHQISYHHHSVFSLSFFPYSIHFNYIQFKPALPATQPPDKQILSVHVATSTISTFILNIPAYCHY